MQRTEIELGQVNRSYRVLIYLFTLFKIDLYLFEGTLLVMLTLGSEDNLQESVFFPYVGPRYQTQVLSFGGKHLYFAEPFCQPHLFIETLTNYFPHARF